MNTNGPGSWGARVREAVGSSKWGLGGALLANLCCAPAAVSIALGLGGSAFLVGLAQYKLYFALIGLAAMSPAGLAAAAAHRQLLGPRAPGAPLAVRVHHLDLRGRLPGDQLPAVALAVHDLMNPMIHG